jgi:hypothetical protein
MALQQISERAAAALGGARAVVTGTGKDTRILWNDGLIQGNYRMGEMGCPAPLPSPVVAAQYLETVPYEGFFVVLRSEQ